MVLLRTLSDNFGACPTGELPGNTPFACRRGMVSFQLHSIETIMAKPTAELDDTTCQFSPESRNQAVPILQLFGRNCSGLAVCLRVHKVYPYFFVELHDDIIETLVLYRHFFVS
jgi:hypothetical protein